MLAMLNEKDKIRITFFHEAFDRGIGYPFMDKSQLQTLNLQEKFDSVIQSYKTINMNTNNSLTANIIIAHLPSGSGAKKRSHPYQSQQEYFDDNSNYITFENDDNYCLIRAVIIAIANYENDPNLNKLLKYRSNLLHNKVIQVAKRCQIGDKPCGIQELKKLEVYFKEFQITLLNADSKFDSKPVYTGLKNSKFFYLYHTGNHYNVIKSMKVFTNKSFYCDFCKIGYNNRIEHKCKNLCKMCNRLNCTASNKIRCEFCDVSCNEKSV